VTEGRERKNYVKEVDHDTEEEEENKEATRGHEPWTLATQIN